MPPADADNRDSGSTKRNLRRESLPSAAAEENAATDKAFQPRVSDTLQPAKSFAQRVWRRLTVWMPTLANPHERRCLIRYESRDARTGLKWTVVLPRQCWKCGVTEELDPERFETQLKVYHQPVMIVSLAFAGIVLLLFTTFCIDWFVVLICSAVIIGGAALLLKLKSWHEEAKLHIWTCRKHADELVQPDMIIEDESLNIFLPTPELAKAAQADLKERRRHGGRANDQAGSGATAPAPAGPSEPVDTSHSRSPYRPPAASREELPPIKLHGDDDDDLLADSGPSASTNPASGGAPQHQRSPRPADKQDNPRESDPRESESPREGKRRKDDRPWFDD